MRIRTVVAHAAATIAMVTLASVPALAQQFEPVENAAREQLPAPQFVGAAYAFIWLAILGYVAFVARNLAKTRTEIEELKRRVERSTGGSGGGGGAGGGGRAAG